MVTLRDGLEPLPWARSTLNITALCPPTHAAAASSAAGQLSGAKLVPWILFIASSRRFQRDSLTPLELRSSN